MEPLSLPDDVLGEILSLCSIKTQSNAKLSMCSSSLRAQAWDFVEGFALSEVEPSYVLHSLRALYNNRSKLSRFCSLSIDREPYEGLRPAIIEFLHEFAVAMAPKLTHFGQTGISKPGIWPVGFYKHLDPTRLRVLRVQALLPRQYRDLFQVGFPQLEELSFTHSMMASADDNVLVELLQLIAEKTGNLRTFKFQITFGTTEFYPEILAAIRELVSSNPHLTLLDLSITKFNNIDNDLSRLLHDPLVSKEQKCLEVFGLPLAKIRFCSHSLWQALVVIPNLDDLPTDVSHNKLETAWRLCYPIAKGATGPSQSELLDQVAAFAVCNNCGIKTTKTIEFLLGRFEEVYSQLSDELRLRPEAVRGLVGVCLATHKAHFSHASTFLKRLAEVLVQKAHSLAYLVDCLDGSQLLFHHDIYALLIESGYLGETVSLTSGSFVPKLLQFESGPKTLFELLRFERSEPHFDANHLDLEYLIEYIIEKQPEWTSDYLLEQAARLPCSWFQPKKISSDESNMRFLLHRIAPTFGCLVLRRALVAVAVERGVERAATLKKIVSLLWKVWDAECTSIPTVTRTQIVMAFGEPGDESFGLSAVLARK